MIFNPHITKSGGVINTTARTDGNSVVFENLLDEPKWFVAVNEGGGASESGYNYYLCTFDGSKYTRQYAYVSSGKIGIGTNTNTPSYHPDIVYENGQLKFTTNNSTKYGNSNDTWHLYYTI